MLRRHGLQEAKFSKTLNVSVLTGGGRRRRLLLSGRDPPAPSSRVQMAARPAPRRLLPGFPGQPAWGGAIRGPHWTAGVGTSAHTAVRLRCGCGFQASLPLPGEFASPAPATLWAPPPRHRPCCPTAIPGGSPEGLTPPRSPGPCPSSCCPRGHRRAVPCGAPRPATSSTTGPHPAA